MRKITLAILLIAALSGCQKSPSQLEKITFAYTVQPQGTLVHVAVAKGYFIEEGLDVQASIHTFGKVALQTLLDHKADFAAVAETPFMFNVLKGEKICVIANIEASNMNNAIVARKDAGISAPGDLKGKRIGFTPGTTSDFFLDSILTSIDLTRQAIKPVALKPDEMQAAIVGKKVDAVCTWNYPLTQIKRLLGVNGIMFYDREIYTETFNVASQQDYVQKNPETVRRLLRAMIKAENFVAQHPDEAQSIVSAATKTDQDIVREVWSAFAYRVALDKRIIITLEDETRWAMKNRLTDQTVMPDYLTYIYLDGLRAVKPEAVKIGR
jgi:ABC-type nitrate/sulfonate/bicarbonate transport system substrate-binding protein